MKLPHSLLSGLIVTVGSLCILSGVAQPSLSVEAQPGTITKNQQPGFKNLQQAEAYNNRGVDLAQQGKTSQAIAAFQQAIRIYPAYENAHNNLGLALGSENKFPEAAAAFKQALAINPKNIETYNNLGIALGSQGKFSEAVAAFSQAIQINPNEPTSHHNLGVAFWSQRKISEAAASLQKARELYSSQNNTEGVEQVGTILQQIQKTPIAN